MGSSITLKAADGHTLSAWRDGPDSASRGLVVVQEIFGVNQHMRNVCAKFAAEGYAVVAPALFDRVRPGIELGYTPDDVATGRELRGKVAEAGTMADIDAAAAARVAAMPPPYQPQAALKWCVRVAPSQATVPPQQ